MEEKILQTKKNGMVMLLLTLLGYVVFTALFVYSLILLDTSLFPGILLMALSILYWVAGIFLFCGLKVLKPQEALVLTLFGDYIGTLKGQGFYWVNPFCTAVNPAAGTKLSQSGDVNSSDPPDRQRPERSSPGWQGAARSCSGCRPGTASGTGHGRRRRPPSAR